MDVAALPDDVLHEIFRQLYGKIIIQCRLVCRRWRDAVDCLSDSDWKKICSNGCFSDEYEAARNKYGLSWRETFRALHSWSSIASAEMTARELCQNVYQFKVLPKGIVVCLKNERHSARHGDSDTLVYYDTDTFQECDRDEYDFVFSSRQYDENEYFKVLVLHDGSLCIVLKENKRQYIVGNLDYGFENLYFSKFGQFSLIGTEIYFKNARDEVIYVSKYRTKENGGATIETTPLEAFLENHESYEECIVGFSLKHGNVNILSDEGNKGNIYIHEKADFSWATQLCYDHSDIFAELQEYGFNWKSSAIYHWLSTSTNLCRRPAFYSHGGVYLTTRSYGKVVCIHYCPYYVFGPENVLNIFKGKPVRRIPIKDFLPESSSYKTAFVNQLDIVETVKSHKIIVLVARKLFVLEFTPSNATKLRFPRVARDKTTVLKKVLQVKKKPIETANKKSTTNSETAEIGKLPKIKVKCTVAPNKKIFLTAKKRSLRVAAAKKKTTQAAKKKAAAAAKRKTAKV